MENSADQNQKPCSVALDLDQHYSPTPTFCDIKAQMD